MALQIRKAQRKKAKLRLALLGPTGSGKTMSALKVAFGLGGKIGLIDTENGSGDLYAHLGDYDVITLDAPYTVQKYREAIHAFEKAGYETIIIDSLSHAWAGEGGLLDKQGHMEKSGAARNSFAAWREITPEHNRLVEDMLSSPAHIIATLRVKMEWVLEVNEKGKQVPRKVGLAPIQRDGLIYEFTICMDIAENHVASASKDRTSMFDGWHDVISEETGHKIRAWLEEGTDAPASVVATVETSTPKPSRADALDAAARKEAWFVKFGDDLRACADGDALDALIGSKPVQAILARQDDDSARVNDLVQATLERLATAEAEAV